MMDAINTMLQMAPVLRLLIVKTLATYTTKLPRFAPFSTELAYLDARKLMVVQPAQFVMTDGLWEPMENAPLILSQSMVAKHSIPRLENAPNAGIISILWIQTILIPFGVSIS